MIGPDKVKLNIEQEDEDGYEEAVEAIEKQLKKSTEETPYVYLDFVIRRPAVRKRIIQEYQNAGWEEVVIMESDIIRSTIAFRKSHFIPQEIGYLDKTWLKYFWEQACNIGSALILFAGAGVFLFAHYFLLYLMQRTKVILKSAYKKSRLGRYGD